MVLHHYMSVNPITGFHLTPDNNSPATLLRVVIKKCFQALSAWGQNHLQVTTTDLYENLKKKKQDWSVATEPRTVMREPLRIFWSLIVVMVIFNVIKLIT